jgi:hypothetical protein
MRFAFLFTLGLFACGRVESGPGDMDDPDAMPLVDGAGGTPDSSAPPTCDDRAQNQGESDVDCGGPCAPCEPNLKCTAPADCATASCTAGFCTLMTGPPSWVSVASLPTYSGTMGAGYANGTVWVADNTRTGYWSGSGWTEIPSGDTRTIGIPTQTPSVVGDGTNLWFIGGRDSDGERADRAWGLPPAAAAWTALADITPARSWLAVAMGPDGKLYALGGSIGIESEASSFNQVVESYDPPPAAAGVKGWDQSPPDLPFGVLRHAAATTGPYLYSIGGQAFGGNVATTLRWKPGDTSWSTVAALPAPLHNHGAAGGPDGRLYVVGGGELTAAVATVHVYVPEIDRWFPVAPMAQARTTHGVTIGPDGRIWAVGGQASGSLNSVEVYGPVLAMNPETGPANTQIQIAGSNFAANATVTLRLGTREGTVIGTVTTNATGQTMNPISYTVPGTAAPGSRIVIHAVDEKSRYPVNRAFLVN